MFDLFWDGVWYVAVAHARLGVKILKAHDRHVDRKLARRYPPAPVSITVVGDRRYGKSYVDLRDAA